MLQVEDLLRLPDEIAELGKNATQFGSDVSFKDGVAVSFKDRQAAQPGKDGLPESNDAILFASKSAEEQARILQRREEALVQNKVLRALARRGLNLRELFEMLDEDDSGELDADEFISGIQQVQALSFFKASATPYKRCDARMFCHTA